MNVSKIFIIEQWTFGRRGVCGGLKILLRVFDSLGVHNEMWGCKP